MYDYLKNLRDSEEKRLGEQFNLIASENLPSRFVQKAIGSLLSVKYSEGYPGKRYYAGCKYIDEIELECQRLWKEAFKTDYAVNVQMPSGSQANQAVYMTILDPGDTILSMDLLCGGHLSHSMKSNFVGKFYNIVTYGVNEDELIDYDEVERLAHKHKPKLIIAGSSSYSRVIDYARFSQIAKDVGAYFLADIAHPAGLIAKGLYPSPFGLADFVTSTTQKTLRGPRSALVFCKPEFEARMNRAAFPGLIGGCQQNMVLAKAVTAYEITNNNMNSFGNYIKHTKSSAKMMADLFMRRGYRIVSAGTDCHMFVVDIGDRGLSGKEAQDNLESVNICTNMNVIPYDTRKPADPSGIRLGTAFMNSRGALLMHFQEISNVIMDVFDDMEHGTFVKGNQNYIDRVNKVLSQIKPITKTNWNN